jgi:molybdenum cofactor cytidylyltransferase
VLAAVILSAGESSRMGSPKALVPFRGRTFLEHLLDAVRQASSSIKSSTTSSAGIGWTRVVLGAHVREISEALRLDAETVIVNPRWKDGQLSSIQAAIEGLSRLPTDGLLLFLVDHPLVSAGLLKKLVEVFYETSDSIVLPTYLGKRGHPVIFARRLYAELLAAPQNQGARAVVWAHAAEVLEVPTDEEGVVLNLNDPEALRKALADDAPDAQG